MAYEQLLSQIFNQSSDGLLLLENSVFIDCNPTAILLLGCQDKSEIIGKRPSDFSPEYQPDGARSDERESTLIDQAIEQGNVCFEWVHQSVDGTLLPFEILLTAVTWDGRQIIHSNWRDISQRRKTEQALAYRRQLETLITRTSTAFINLPAEAVDNGIQQVLSDLGRFVEADRSYVFAYQDDQMKNLYEWCAPGIEPQIHRMQDIPIKAMAWSNDKIRRGEILNTPCVDDLPPAAQPEKDEFKIQGIVSVLVVPMEWHGEVVGFIGFDAVRRQHQWPEEIVDLMRIAAGIIANVMGRRDAEMALREANITLEHKVRQRTRELERRRQIAESLRETLRVVNSNRSLADTLDHIVQQSVMMTDAAAGTLYSINMQTQTGCIEASIGVLEEEARYFRFDLASTSGQEMLQIIAQRKPIMSYFDKANIDRIRTDPNVTPTIRARRLEIFQQFSGSVSVPIFVRDEPFGALLLYFDKLQTLSDLQLEPVVILAEQAALVIENARLHQSEQDRRNEAEQRHRIADGLRAGLSVLNSDRSLDDILEFVVEQAVQLLNTGGGALYLLDAKREMLYVGASYGLRKAYTSLELPVGGAITGRAFARGEPVSMSDMQAGRHLLERYLNEPNIPAGWSDALGQLTADYNAVLSVPVRTSRHTYGTLTLYYPESQQFTDDVISLAVAFAGQAALVIENARLRERARETAAIEERNRLARDLHDAVTQTLFSASIIADTIPDLWDVDPEDARRQLNRLTQLTRGALAEMRSLLIELRPARLVEADMTTLLQQLIDAVRGRSRVHITLNVQGTCQVPDDVKIGLYRIAQEALNNIVKHAGASRAFVSFRCNPQQVTLQVLDDGCGFDIHTAKAGHFGIQIMNERAAAIGATFVLDTSPGEGTDIEVLWSKS